MYKILPYKIGSASAKKLKEELNAVFIKLKNSNYRYRDGHVVINWGNSKRPNVLRGVKMLNEPEAVAVATNKLDAFKMLENMDVRTVPFTTYREEATEWLDEGNKVFVRHALAGHSGEGIEVVDADGYEGARHLNDIIAGLYELGRDEMADQLQLERREMVVNQIPDAPLYTLGIKNRGEYRVHVFNGEVILYQKKSRRVDEETGEVITAEGEDADVRNLASNWVYRTGNLKRLERVENLAINAIEALGLDFGAVDIVMDQDGDVYVLEVNTAPGLGNTDTAEAYRKAFTNDVELF